MSCAVVEQKAVRALPLLSTKNKSVAFAQTREPQNFLKSSRLLTERDFSQLLSHAHRGGAKAGRILFCGDFRVYRGPDVGAPRLGVAIARKTIKQAVVRNRIRRCVREFFRLNRASLNGDYLIKVDRRPKDLSCSSLVEPLERLLMKRESA